MVRLLFSAHPEIALKLLIATIRYPLRLMNHCSPVEIYLSRKGKLSPVHREVSNV